MKVLISGGHLTPALAFIDFLRQHHPDDEVVFVGRLYSKSNNEQISQEASEIQKRGIYFIAFETGKFVYSKPLLLFKNGLLLIGGLISAFFIIAKQRPTVFLSFGGYLAVPLAIAAWLWGIPVVTHEQTHSLGFANKLIARVATSVALSHQESKDFVDDNKSVVTGNIIRQTVLEKSSVPPSWYTALQEKPLLYVTGGSQGSEVINATVLGALKQLTKEWTVIHQCGASTAKRNYLSELTRAKKLLPKSQQSSYFVREWVRDDELAWIYTTCHCMISRSGANTAEEAARRQIPTLFIPLPFSHNQEQLENARYLVDKRMAMMLPQKSLNPNMLISTLAELKKHSHSIRIRLKELTYKKNAPDALYKTLTSALHT